MLDGNNFNRKALILWDMAGTLIDYRHGSVATLPGIEAQLALLRENYRLLVTTGDFTDSARRLLAENGLLDYFEAVFGDLFSGTGKPYGQVIKAAGGEPEFCLAIGDRLPGDLPGDSADVVSILINRRGFTTNAADVVELIGHLRVGGDSFLDGFRNLYDTAQTVAEAGNAPSSRPRLRHDGNVRYLITWFEHDSFDAARPLILLDG